VKQQLRVLYLMFSGALMGFILAKWTEGSVAFDFLEGFLFLGVAGLATATLRYRGKPLGDKRG